MMEGKGGSNKLAEMIAKIGSDNTFVFAATTDEVKDTYSQLISELGSYRKSVSYWKLQVNTSWPLNPVRCSCVPAARCEDAQASKGIFMQQCSATLAKVMLPARDAVESIKCDLLSRVQFGSELAGTLTSVTDTITNQ